MSNKPESLVFADDRPSSLDDTLYQWAVDAEDMIREMQKPIDDLNNANSMQDKRNIENVVQEIMTLIDGYAASASINLRMLIESKLRDLMREQEEEIRVAVARYNLASEIIEARSLLRAHGITNASGVER